MKLSKLAQKLADKHKITHYVVKYNGDKHARVCRDYIKYLGGVTIHSTHHPKK